VEQADDTGMIQVDVTAVEYNADVYTVEGYETLEEAQADGKSGRDDNAYTFNLCGQCIYTLTYGEG